MVDVTNFGGLTTQFLLEFDPAKLTKYNISLASDHPGDQRQQRQRGRQHMDRGQQGFVVRGVGLISGLDDLGNIVVTQKNGVPVLIKDLGEVKLGHPQRRGILGKDDNPDTIEGITLMLKLKIHHARWKGCMRRYAI